MKPIAVLLAGLIMAPACAAAIPEKMDITEMANCTAAAMKSGDRALWNEWLAGLKKRYAVIYPAKSAAEIEQYTIGRVQDKRRRLQGMGIDSTSANRDYLAKNCKS
ncbi:hypothetical protein [Xanthomonas citri]|uniref:hypothetical protein n=1 Tax=Xanthomonas citri TaxID=346 RepID=UPI001CC081E5|nr:hypothetical protein [Xanthomonas citri]